MSADFPPELRAELLDDFYSEADEHLNAIRDSLVVLENSVGRAQIDHSVIERLFRSFHSFKGISAIVGLKPAEALAHRVEDHLRDFARGTATLNGPGLDLFMAATQRLEQVVRAHRENVALPEVDSLMKKLAEASPRPLAGQPDQPPSRPVTSSSKLGAGIEADCLRGALVWRCTFVPSAALDQRGVNINSVRARLSEIGEIVSATPQVLPEGTIAFEFVISLRETLSDLTAWEKDAVTFQLIEEAAGTERASTRIPSEMEQDHNPFVAPSHVVRVDLSRLDELMRLTGELVIHRSRLTEQLARAARAEAPLDAESLGEINDSLARSLRDLREGIMRVRLVPVAEIFSRMPFVVRDFARETGKKVRLNLSGQQTEIDKFLVERLKDPLLHLVRNAVSHGIESPEERETAGKPSTATISLNASTVGDCALIEVSDDGRGIDPQYVARCAVARGLKVPETLDHAALLELLCSPGFSTREEADLAAGRGVGMAVVNNAVRELGGTLTLQSQPGQSTRFLLRLPLTLAIAQAFIVSGGDQTFAVPQTFVQEILQMNPEQVHQVNRTEMLPYRDGVLPLFRLSSLMRRAPSARARSLVLVLSSERGSVGLVVDQVHGQREVVVRSIRDPLIKAPGIAGATELGDGRPVLIIDAAALTDGAVRPHAPGIRERAVPAPATRGPVSLALAT